MDLDTGLSDLISAMNLHPGVETTGSCAGHWRACKRVDAVNEDRLESLDFDAYWSLFCTYSQAPYVQFRAYPGQADIQQFIEKAKRITVAGGIHVFHEADEITIGMGASGEETVDERHAVPWSCPPRTEFDAFWTQFVECWNSSVDSNYFICITPRSYPTKSTKCCQCAR